MNIVLTDTSTLTNADIDLSVFEQFGTVKLFDLIKQSELVEKLKGVQAVLCNKTVFNRETLLQLPDLRYIGLFATGYNNIDTACARELGITVCNAGSYSTDAVAQHVFALILNHFSMAEQYNAFTQNGGWANSKTFCPLVFTTHEIKEKTLGIIGYGSIGKQVARIANAFNMRVLVYTRTPQNDPSVTFCGFDELLAQSDIITVHCPLNDASNQMFNDETFKKCKKSAYFINTARGGIVKESALIRALTEQTIAGAAIDVLESEPMSSESSLYGVKNLTITPHVAWSPIETRLRLLNIVQDNLRSFINGSPKNVVN